MSGEPKLCPKCGSKEIWTFCDRCKMWHSIESLADYTYDVLRHRCDKCGTEFLVSVR